MAESIIDSAIPDTPFDGIDIQNLDGWIRYDSSRVRKEDNRKGLDGDSRDRYSDSWIRFDDN